MADIAMLVAEEYERRVKNSRKCGNSGEEEVELFSGVSSFLAKKMNEYNWNFKNKLIGDGNHIKEVMIKWLPDPKSQIGVAAINGLFSA